MNKTSISVVISFLVAGYSFAGGLKGKIKTGNESLSNVVVFLEPEAVTSFSKPKETAVMDQVNLRFVPHVLPVLAGTKVIFPNRDKIRHSVFSVGKVKKFDFGTYPPGTEKSITCDKPGVIPILCYVHHDMSAYIIVLKTPYFSLTSNEGEYTINNVPSGNYKLSFWHEDFEIETEEIFIPEAGKVNKNFVVE